MKPAWHVPKNLERILEQDGGIWESDRHAPFQLTVMQGTVYHGRDIPLAWQLEFEPGDPQFRVANAQLEAHGLQADGDGWASWIIQAHPALGLHVDDSEQATCVIWTESQDACRQVLEWLRDTLRANPA